jgi:hypothetical protein
LIDGPERVINGDPDIWRNVCFSQGAEIHCALSMLIIAAFWTSLPHPRPKYALRSH